MDEQGLADLMTQASNSDVVGFVLVHNHLELQVEFTVNQ